MLQNRNFAAVALKSP